MLFQDGYAYICLGEGGLIVLDISDPSRPRRVAANSAFNALSIASNGKELFVGAAPAGLEILAPYVPAVEVRAVLSGNEIVLRVSGRAGQNVRVQRSTNLQNGWTDWKTLTLTSEHAETTESIGPGNPAAYFRTIVGSGP